MTAYDAVALNPNSADSSGRLDTTGTNYTATIVAPQESVGPANVFGGSSALALATCLVTGRLDTTGSVWNSVLIAILQAVAAGRFDTTGSIYMARFIPISAVYRNGDRITLAGIATTLAGQPLRSVQLQFIGLTVQDHFFGAGTDTQGIYVAYLDTGDSYDAYAFSPSTGLVFRLDHEAATPNTTTLTFRQITKRGGFGEGLFLKGGT